MSQSRARDDAFPLPRRPANPRARSFIIVAATLVWFSLDERYRRSRLALALTLIEPIFVVAIFGFTRSVAFDTQPQFGSSATLFYATGVLPYYLFYHVSIRFRDFDDKRPLPQVSKPQLMAALITGELLMKLIIMILCFGTLYLYGARDACPRDVFGLLPPLLFIVVLGVSIGLINVVITSVFSGWIYIYAPVARTMMALSGVLVVVDRMPPNIRRWLVWNPFTHCVLWFRSAFYSHYPADSLNILYLTKCCAIIAAVMVVAVWGTQARRNE